MDLLARSPEPSESPAPLDFKVYQGTLGPHPVLAELARVPGGGVLGRYCYLKNGVDLFIRGRQAKASGELRLEEPRYA